VAGKPPKKPISTWAAANAQRQAAAIYLPKPSAPF
jgi:hypothetical protein